MLRERAQEPHFPRGSRVRTPLGYLDVQAPLSAITIAPPTEEMGCGGCTSNTLQLQP